MQTKVFAPGYEVDEKGWYHFPRDVKERKDLWRLVDTTLHPAKANIHMTRELIRYVSEPGETVIDFFGGVGTSMVGALDGRNVWLLEIDPDYHEMQKTTYNDWVERGIATGKVTCILGDNRQILPIPCDHMVSSPPYAQTMKGGSDRFGKGQSKEVMAKYANNALNIGNLNPFVYKEAMSKLYEKCVQSVRPGGTITIIIKDQAQGNDRIFHSEPMIKTMSDLGMRMVDWFKWKTPGTAFASLHKSKGHNVVEDEDLIVFRKP